MRGWKGVRFFSCKGAPLEVLMYVCLSVCVQFEILDLYMFQNVPECSRMFYKCSRMLQNIPEGSRKFQKVIVACMQLQ